MKVVRTTLLIAIIFIAATWVTTYLMPVFALRQETAIGAVKGKIVYWHLPGWLFETIGGRLLTDPDDYIAFLNAAENKSPEGASTRFCP